MLGSSAGMPAAWGDPSPTSTPTDVAAAQEELDQVTKDLVEADKKLKETDKSLAAAKKDADKANAALKTAEGKRDARKSEYTKAKAASDKANGALKTSQDRQNTAKRHVGTIARQSFEAGGLGPLTFTIHLLSSSQDVGGAMAVSEMLLKRQQTDVQTLGKTIEQQKKAAQTAADKSREANLAKVKSDAAYTSASDAAKKANAAKQKVEDLKQRQTQEKKDLEAKKKAAKKDLDEAVAEQQRLETLATTSTGLDPSSVSGVGQSGYLTAPGPRSSVVSPYGYRIHPVLHYRKLHAGDDYPFACGTPVYAAGDGTVIEANYNGVSGNHVYISHGTVNGVQLSTAYMHFTSLTVSLGQKVKRGQQIGISGTTGRSTGCHLHFEVRENGVAVNPKNWVG